MTEILRLNFTTATGEAFAGYDNVDPSEDYPVITGVDGLQLAGWSTADPVTGARDQDSGSSPDERYDSVHFQIPADGDAKFQMLLPAGLYRARVVVGEPDAAGFNGVSISVDNGQTVVFWAGTDGNTAAAEWKDKTLTFEVSAANEAAGDKANLVIASTGSGIESARLAFLVVEKLGEPASETTLIAAIKSEVETVALVGPVYSTIVGFSGAGPLQTAATVTLPDATQRMRLVMIKHHQERKPYSNGTDEIVHQVALQVLQAKSSDTDGTVQSEEEVRATADQIMAILSDDKPGSAMGVAVGAGWLGAHPDNGLPQQSEIEMIEWQGVTWHRATVTIRVSEEVDRS